MQDNPFLSRVFKTNEKITVFYMQPGEFFHRSTDCLALVELARLFAGENLRNRVKFFPVRTDPLQSLTLSNLIYWKNKNDGIKNRDIHDWSEKDQTYLEDFFECILKCKTDKPKSIDQYQDTITELLKQQPNKPSKEPSDKTIEAILSSLLVDKLLNFITYRGDEYRAIEDIYPDIPESTIWIIVGRPQHYTIWQKDGWFRDLQSLAGYPARYLIPPSIEDDEQTQNNLFLDNRLKNSARLKTMIDRKSGQKYKISSGSIKYRDDYGLIFKNIVMSEGIRRTIVVCAGLSDGGTYAATKFISDPTWYSQLVGIDQISEDEGPIEVGLRVKCKETNQESLYVGREEISLDQIEILNNDPIDYLGLTYWTAKSGRPYSYVIDNNELGKRRIVPYRQSKEFAKTQKLENPLRALYTLLPYQANNGEEAPSTKELKERIFEVMNWCNFKDDNGNPEYKSNVDYVEQNGGTYRFKVKNEFISYKKNGVYEDEYYICGNRTKDSIKENIFEYIKNAVNDYSKKQPKPILILGDSGTGKERLYDVIRYEYAVKIKNRDSSITSVPLEIVNCAEHGEKLMEFLQKGFLKQQNVLYPCVLVLDEFGDFPNKMSQAAMLRFLQDGTFKNKENDNDTGELLTNKVFIVAGTSRPLKKMVEEEKMLPDLLSRFDIFELTPMTERSEDAALLLFELIRQKLNDSKNKNIYVDEIYIQPVALQILLSYTFPGNARDVDKVAGKMKDIILQRGDTNIRIYTKDMRAVLACSPNGSHENSNVWLVYDFSRKIKPAHLSYSLAIIEG
ncbi:MAG: sigma 54-interacting transcriptional regulator [Nitrospirae bacterium]|uniref:sigma 54-interacting transcriptional regulator n=1 Tax=Candidatus Magnetobacterium casense TaxID=1455061 RepID=UPI00058CF446|nr:sigma 54-interacting transcriptional regulator [Candidatus Magnetobacterium casensis]MBF0338854.1 sigma 54-interacting transcriptional regulator [Nitrospirota bacterium]